MTSMKTATKEEREPLLDRSDRCEATCPAAAMVRVTTKKLGVFQFCGHHYDLNKDVIPGVIRVHDERNPIKAIAKVEPTTSPEGETE